MEHSGDVFVIVSFIKVMRKLEHTDCRKVIEKYIPIVAAVAVLIKKAHITSSKTHKLPMLLYIFLLQMSILFHQYAQNQQNYVNILYILMTSTYKSNIATGKRFISLFSCNFAS